MTALDLSWLGKAIAQLRIGLQTLDASPDNPLYRDGVIQRFNVIYRWQAFREARNITSHTYDPAKAERVMAIVPDFLTEAEYLYEQLQQRSG